MDEWSTYQDEQESERRQRRLDLWRTLDEQDELPKPELLKSLSGLPDIDHFQDHWDDLNPERRRALIRALSDLASHDFKLDFSAIFRATLQDADGEIRATSILGLREIQDVRLVPVLTQILRDDTAVAARAAAAVALGDYVLLGELGKTRPETFQSAVTALRESFRDKNEQAEVQRHAIAAIAYTEAGDTADLIQDAYEDASEAMQISAVLAMGRSANPKWQRIVLRELNSTNPTMRIEATRASGELQLRDAADDIARLTDDVDQEVRLTALWALGQIGGRVARQTLVSFVESEDPEIQRQAREALQELEFFHGDTDTFFGPPSDFSSDAEEPWMFTDLLDDAVDDSEDADDDDEWV